MARIFAGPVSPIVSPEVGGGEVLYSAVNRKSIIGLYVLAYQKDATPGLTYAVMASAGAVGVFVKDFSTRVAANEYVENDPDGLL